MRSVEGLKHQRVAVLGGGIAGLCLGYQLVRRGIAVDLYAGTARPVSEIATGVASLRGIHEARAPLFAAKIRGHFALWQMMEHLASWGPDQAISALEKARGWPRGRWPRGGWQNYARGVSEPYESSEEFFRRSERTYHYHRSSGKSISYRGDGSWGQSLGVGGVPTSGDYLAVRYYPADYVYDPSWLLHSLRNYIRTGGSYGDGSGKSSLSQGSVLPKCVAGSESIFISRARNRIIEEDVQEVTIRTATEASSQRSVGSLPSHHYKIEIAGECYSHLMIALGERTSSMIKSVRDQLVFLGVGHNLDSGDGDDHSGEKHNVGYAITGHLSGVDRLRDKIPWNQSALFLPHKGLWGWKRGSESLRGHMVAGSDEVPSSSHDHAIIYWGSIDGPASSPTASYFGACDGTLELGGMLLKIKERLSLWWGDDVVEGLKVAQVRSGVRVRYRGGRPLCGFLAPRESCDSLDSSQSRNNTCSLGLRIAALAGLHKSGYALAPYLAGILVNQVGGPCLTSGLTPYLTNNHPRADEDDLSWTLRPWQIG